MGWNTQKAHQGPKGYKPVKLWPWGCCGSKVITIEGLATNGKMHPMQEAFKKLHGLQCGFCTPGMVMSAVDLLQKNKKPSDTEIRDWLEGNICRCTGYQNIVAAVKEAATKM